MTNLIMPLGLAALTICLSAGAAFAQELSYASDRSAHKFVGATRVVLDDFDPMDNDAKFASLQMDNNNVSFSRFGERRITTVFYQSFPIRLTRLNGADSDGGARLIFSVELPAEHATALGANSLRLVVLPQSKSQPRGVRLLLINLQGQVTETLELRTQGSGSVDIRFACAD